MSEIRVAIFSENVERHSLQHTLNKFLEQIKDPERISDIKFWSTEHMNFAAVMYYDPRIAENERHDEDVKKHLEKIKQRFPST